MTKKVKEHIKFHYLLTVLEKHFKNSNVRNTKQNRLMLYQIVLFAVRKGQGTSKIRKLVD